jgi:hypothetical protein
MHFESARIYSDASAAHKRILPLPLPWEMKKKLGLFLSGSLKRKNLILQKCSTLMIMYSYGGLLYFHSN